MTGRLLLSVGAVLMALLGILRGAGGVALLVQGSAVDPAIRATSTTVAILGFILFALGGALITAAVGVFRSRRRAEVWGLWLTIAFVIDGGINGYLLYGRPGDRGTAVNLIVAALIVSCLFFGRRTLKQAAGRA